MRYRDDPILKAKAGEQPAPEPQPGAKRRRYLPTFPRYKPRTGRGALGARFVLWLVVLLIFLGIAGYLLLHR
jgi:hypothetical protein